MDSTEMAVFEDGSALSDDQMQRLAREMNLSETVFLLPAEDGDARRCRTTNGGYAAARYSGGSAAGAQTTSPLRGSRSTQRERANIRAICFRWLRAGDQLC